MPIPSPKKKKKKDKKNRGMTSEEEAIDAAARELLRKAGMDLGDLEA